MTRTMPPIVQKNSILPIMPITRKTRPNIIMCESPRFVLCSSRQLPGKPGAKSRGDGARRTHQRRPPTRHTTNTTWVRRARAHPCCSSGPSPERPARSASAGPRGSSARRRSCGRRRSWSRLVVPSLAVTEICHLVADPQRRGRTGLAGEYRAGPGLVACRSAGTPDAGPALLNAGGPWQESPPSGPR
jgi:hypothetical protein